MSWYRLNGTHLRGIHVTYEENTIIYHARVYIMRKLPGRFKDPPSASEWAFQGLEVAREEDVERVARQDVMRTKNGSRPAQLLQKGFCKLISWKEYYVQDKLAIMRTNWKHLETTGGKVQNENEAALSGYP